MDFSVSSLEFNCVPALACHVQAVGLHCPVLALRTLSRATQSPCQVRERDGKRSVELSWEGEEIADVDVFKRIETRAFSAEFIYLNFI